MDGTGMYGLLAFTVARRTNEMQKEQLGAFQRAGADCSDEDVRNVTKQGRGDEVAAAVAALSRQPWARSAPSTVGKEIRVL
jgi:hypothetical protein